MRAWSDVLAKCTCRAGLVVALLASAAQAQIVTGSDGSDGAFTFVPDTVGGNTMTIDLALAASGHDGQGQPITWQTPSPIAGRGVYDPSAWAVVFKYSAFTLAANQTIRFRNHPSRAPVAWLVQGNASIAGSVYLTATPTPFGWTEPGPGGFRGAQRGPVPVGGICGFGPGGGWSARPSGNYGGATSASIASPYGSAALFPLLGGSGSSSPNGGVYGVSAAGALLLAANQTIELLPTAILSAVGTTLGNVVFSSGGGIRLVANVYAQHPAAQLRATGSIGDDQCTGRIRIEANSMPGSTAAIPAASIGTPGLLFPDATTPVVRVVSLTIDGQTFPVSADPRAEFSAPEADVQVDVTGEAVLTIEARNVTPGRTCEVRVGGSPGDARFFVSSPLAGSISSSTATVSVPLGIGVHCVQVRVIL